MANNPQNDPRRLKNKSHQIEVEIGTGIKPSTEIMEIMLLKLENNGKIGY